MDNKDLLLLAISSSLEVALELAELLPQTDLCEQIKACLYEQSEFVMRSDAGDFFSREEVANHCQNCRRSIFEIQKIKKAKGIIPW